MSTINFRTTKGNYELVEIAIIIVALILTFYFSGTETAFISVNRVRIEVWRRQKMKTADIIARFLLKPERFIYTTLVGNNIANVAFASYATVYFSHYLDHELTWLVVTAITVVWGEIIPKTLFRSLADWIIRKVAPLLQMFYYIFQPMIWVVSHISRFLLNSFHYPEKEISDFFSKKDVEILIRESQNYVNIDESENKILRSLLNLRLLRVRDAMIPRTEIIAVPENTPVENLIEVFQKSGFTKIPVFRESLDDIIGVVFLKDIFTQPESIQEVLREVMYVPETKRSSQLLREFRKKNNTIAIVIDEYGGTAGLVTGEDLIEEVVGEIIDEFDSPAIYIRKRGEKTYSVNARIEPEQLRDELGIELPKGDYDTLAGFVLFQMGHIPHRDESFEFRGVKYVITRATRRKVEWVRIILP